MLDSGYGVAVPGNPLDGWGLVAGRDCGSMVNTLCSGVTTDISSDKNRDEFRARCGWQRY